MNLLERTHEQFVANRRARVLSEHLAAVIPPGPVRVLDVGCGDGFVAHLVRTLRPEVEFVGIDLQSRPRAWIPVQVYHGRRLPFANDDFDVVSLIDVLHHADDPFDLLEDAARVARTAVVIKDHLRQGLFAGWRLRFMDRVANHRHGISLPFNYWSPQQWRAAFETLGVEPDVWKESLNLYVPPFRMAFDGRLQFIARVPVR